MAADSQEVVFVKVDGDTGTGLVLAYGVSAFPTTMLFAGSKRVGMVRGANSSGIA